MQLCWNRDILHLRRGEMRKVRKVKRISGGAETVGVEKMLSVDREQPLSRLMQTFSAI